MVKGLKVLRVLLLATVALAASGRAYAQNSTSSSTGGVVESSTAVADSGLSAGSSAMTESSSAMAAGSSGVAVSSSAMAESSSGMPGSSSGPPPSSSGPPPSSSGPPPPMSSSGPPPSSSGPPPSSSGPPPPMSSSGPPPPMPSSSGPPPPMLSSSGAFAFAESSGAGHPEAQQCSTDGSLPPCNPTPEGTATRCMVFPSISTIGSCLVPGSVGSICATAADCTPDLFFGASLCQAVSDTETTKVCMPDLTNLFGSSGIQWISNPVAPPGLCRTTADCGGTRSCVLGFCVDFQPPRLDCTVNGVSSCTAEQDCFSGLCVPHREIVTCSPACNADAGERCNQYFGRCEAGMLPPQCQNCDPASNRCLPPVYPGLPPVCQPIGLSCATSDTCIANNVDTKCMLGFCTSCGALCSMAEDLLASLFQSGGGIAQFSSRVTADLVNVTANGGVRALPGQIMQFNDQRDVRTLTFDAAQAAAGQIEAGTRMVVDTLEATTTGGQMLLSAGARFVSSMLNIGAAGGMTFSLGAGSAQAPTIANFSALALNGPLQISGDYTTRLVFPSLASAVSTPGANGIVRVSGGLALVGNLGAVPLQISGSDTEERDARILANDVLQVAGPILGSKGRLIVSGRMEITGSSVEPQLELVDSARVSIRTRSGNVPCGNLTFSGNGGRLEVDTTANAGGETVVFNLIQSCPASATVQINVQGTALQALASGLTLFSYGVETFSNVGAFTCGIRVCGSDGVCKVVNNPSDTSARRRLLGSEECESNCDSVTLTAAWEPTKLTASSTTPNAASASASVASGVIAALAAFAMLTMRM